MLHPARRELFSKPVSAVGHLHSFSMTPLTFSSIYTLNLTSSKIVGLIVDELWKLYSRKKRLVPLNDLGRVFDASLRRVPGLSRDDIFARQGPREAIGESIKRTKDLLPALHAHQRSLLQDAKLFCLSETKDNILMWSHYTRDHIGAVLEFDSDKNKQSLPLTGPRK